MVTLGPPLVIYEVGSKRSQGAERSKCQKPYGTMLAGNIEEKMQTIYGSWNKPLGPVGSVSIYGRNGSQLENQSRVDDWTALTGKHKLQVLRMLPEKMSLLLPDAIFPRIAALWRVGVSIVMQI